MALRDQMSGEVLSFRACAIELQAGRLELVETTTPSTWTGNLSGVCPVHESGRCVETYLSGRRLASWSLRDFWSWRHNKQAGDAR